MSPNSDHPVYSPITMFDINSIYKFWSSELINHINYLDAISLRLKKPNFIGLQANLRNRERRLKRRWRGRES